MFRKTSPRPRLAHYCFPRAQVKGSAVTTGETAKHSPAEQEARLQEGGHAAGAPAGQRTVRSSDRKRPSPRPPAADGWGRRSERAAAEGRGPAPQFKPQTAACSRERPVPCEDGGRPPGFRFLRCREGRQPREGQAGQQVVDGLPRTATRGHVTQAGQHESAAAGPLRPRAARVRCPVPAGQLPAPPAPCAWSPEALISGSRGLGAILGAGWRCRPRVTQPAVHTDCSQEAMPSPSVYLGSSVQRR